MEKEDYLCEVCSSINYTGVRHLCLSCAIEICPHCCDISFGSHDAQKHSIQPLFTKEQLDFLYGGENLSMLLQCPFPECSFRSTDASLFANHIFDNHKENQSFVLCPLCVVGESGDQFKYHNNIKDHKDCMSQHIEEVHQIYQSRPSEEGQEKNEEEKKAGGTGGGRALTRQNAIKFSQFFENSFNEVFSYLTHSDNSTSEQQRLANRMNRGRLSGRGLMAVKRNSARNKNNSLFANNNNTRQSNNNENRHSTFFAPSIRDQWSRMMADDNRPDRVENSMRTRRNNYQPSTSKNNENNNALGRRKLLDLSPNLAADSSYSDLWNLLDDQVALMEIDDTEDDDMDLVDFEDDDGGDKQEYNFEKDAKDIKDCYMFNAVDWDEEDEKDEDEDEEEDDDDDDDDEDEDEDAIDKEDDNEGVPEDVAENAKNMFLLNDESFTNLPPSFCQNPSRKLFQQEIIVSFLTENQASFSNTPHYLQQFSIQNHSNAQQEEAYRENSLACKEGIETNLKEEQTNGFQDNGEHTENIPSSSESVSTTSSRSTIITNFPSSSNLGARPKTNIKTDKTSKEANQSSKTTLKNFSHKSSTKNGEKTSKPSNALVNNKNISAKSCIKKQVESSLNVLKAPEKNVMQKNVEGKVSSSNLHQKPQTSLNTKHPFECLATTSDYCSSTDHNKTTRNNSLKINKTIQPTSSLQKSKPNLKLHNNVASNKNKLSKAKNSTASSNNSNNNGVLNPAIRSFIIKKNTTTDNVDCPNSKSNKHRKPNF